MNKVNLAKIKSPIWWTVLVLSLSAILGVLIGALFMSVFAIGGIITLSGPFGFLLGMPIILAQLSIGVLLGVLLVPAWAIVGGWIFAGLSSGKFGIATQIGVTLFSFTHPVYLRVNELAKELKLPRIKWVGHFDDKAINAFAIGNNKKNAFIAFSRGAIEKLSKEQLDAVIAHELAHVASRDMARMMYARGVQDALTWFFVFRGLKNVARWVFTPLSELEILRHSRQREYWADAVGAALISPDAMKGALLAIRADQVRPKRRLKRISTFMFRNSDVWTATHPPLESRIRAIDQGKIKVR